MRLGALFTLSRRSHSLAVEARPMLTALASLLGVWLCVRVARQLVWAAVVQDIRRAGLGAVLLLLTPVVGNFVHMLGWRGLLPESMRPALGRAMGIFVTAQAGNEVGSGVLGESFKVSVFPQAERAAALRAVVLDNLTALVALVAVVTSIGAALGGGLVARLMPLPLALGALSVLLLGGAALLKRGLGAGVERNVWAAFLAHYLGKMWIVAEFALALWLVARASWCASAQLGLVATVASVLGAPVPGQLGVLEAALGSSAEWVGVGASALLSVAVLRRVRSLIWVALGAFLFWRLTRVRASVG